MLDHANHIHHNRFRRFYKSKLHVYVPKPKFGLLDLTSLYEMGVLEINDISPVNLTLICYGLVVVSLCCVDETEFTGSNSNIKYHGVCVKDVKTCVRCISCINIPIIR